MTSAARLRALAGGWMLACAAGCVSPPSRIDPARQAAVANDPAALQRIAGVAEQAGDVNSAEALYERAAKLQPESSTGQVDLARTMAQQGRSEEAIDVLAAAHRSHPADPALSAMLGRMLVVAHRPGAALLVFREGLAQAPASPSLLIGEGVALDATGEHAEAQACYQLVLAHDPANVAAGNDLALSIALSGGAGLSAKMLQKLVTVADGKDHGTVEDNLALVRSLPPGSGAPEPSERCAPARAGLVAARSPN